MGRICRNDEQLRGGSRIELQLQLQMTGMVAGEGLWKVGWGRVSSAGRERDREGR